MNLTEAVKGRRSIRGYKTDPVPQELLQEIIETAIHAPSAMNTQPWEITIITGEPLDNIRKGNVETATGGKGPNPEVSSERYEGVYRDRQVGLGKQLFALLDIGREDREKRMAWTLQGFRFFDAPAAIIVSVDKSLSPAHAYTDIGIICRPSV